MITTTSTSSKEKGKTEAIADNADDTDKYKNNFVASATFGFKSNQNKSQVRISSLQ